MLLVKTTWLSLDQNDHFGKIFVHEEGKIDKPLEFTDKARQEGVRVRWRDGTVETLPLIFVDHHEWIADQGTRGRWVMSKDPHVSKSVHGTDVLVPLIKLEVDAASFQ